MKHWFIKDVTRMTKVSAQTLHHYDKIGLLKPSLRAANGYRVYAEKNLQRLQQIIALKFFGFELKQIKTLLDMTSDPLTHLKAQAAFLERKMTALAKVQGVLRQVIDQAQGNDTSACILTWENITRLTEVFQMTQYKHIEPAQQKEYEKYLIEHKLTTPSHIKEVH